MHMRPFSPTQVFPDTVPSPGGEVTSVVPDAATKGDAVSGGIGVLRGTRGTYSSEQAVQAPSVAGFPQGRTPPCAPADSLLFS